MDRAIMAWRSDLGDVEQEGGAVMKKCVVCNEADGVFMNTASGGTHLCEPCFTELRVAIATHGVFGPVAVLHKRWWPRAVKP
jgi:hypothetical protein